VYGSVGALIGRCAATDVIHRVVHSCTLTWDSQDGMLQSGAVIWSPCNWHHSLFGPQSYVNVGLTWQSTAEWWLSLVTMQQGSI